MKGGLFPNRRPHTATFPARPPYVQARKRSRTIPRLSGFAGQLRNFRQTIPQGEQKNPRFCCPYKELNNPPKIHNLYQVSHQALSQQNPFHAYTPRN